MTDKDLKSRTIDRLLYKHLFLMMHINTTVANLVLPEHLYRAPTVTLKISREFRGALEITKDLVRADLLFGDNYFTCLIPLDSIWAVGTPNGHVQFWSDCAPAELLDQTPQKQPTEPSDQSATTRKPPQLRRIK